MGFWELDMPWMVLIISVVIPFMVTFGLRYILRRLDRRRILRRNPVNTDCELKIRTDDKGLVIDVLWPDGHKAQLRLTAGNLEMSALSLLDMFEISQEIRRRGESGKRAGRLAIQPGEINFTPDEE